MRDSKVVMFYGNINNSLISQCYSWGNLRIRVDVAVAGEFGKNGYGLRQLHAVFV
jgi:hypothetical protein